MLQKLVQYLILIYEQQNKYIYQIDNYATLSVFYEMGRVSISCPSAYILYYTIISNQVTDKDMFIYLYICFWSGESTTATF